MVLLVIKIIKKNKKIVLKLLYFLVIVKSISL